MEGAGEWTVSSLKMLKAYKSDKSKNGLSVHDPGKQKKPILEAHHPGSLFTLRNWLNVKEGLRGCSAYDPDYLLINRIEVFEAIRGWGNYSSRPSKEGESS